MSDFNLVDPRGWDCDLQSVYTAYLGYFQLHNVPWYERSWGVFFESFEEFLTFSWPVITVTDADTGKAHIVTRLTSVGAFLKMIKTRFGETIPMVENILRVTPYESSQRHLRTISDYSVYKKLHSTLPAILLSALKSRVRNGEPKLIRELWESRDHTFMSIGFEWSERNQATCLEWGYAAVRCSHLDAVGAWPPDPEPNYRRGHYVVAEYTDRVYNKLRPNFPWAYAFGDTQQIPKAKSIQVLQATISSMLSPDSETVSNSLVLVTHGLVGDLRRLEEMKIRLPHNVLIIDTATYERQLFNLGRRGNMQDPSGKPRQPGSTISLVNLLQSLGTDLHLQVALHNSGNDSFLSLLAFQLLMDPENTKKPTIRGRNQFTGMNMMRTGSRSPAGAMPGIPMPPLPMGVSPITMPMMAPMSPYGMIPMPVPSPGLYPRMLGAGQEGMLSDQSLDSNSHRRASSYIPNVHMPSPLDPRPRRVSALSPPPVDGRGTISRKSSGGVQTNGNGGTSGSGGGDGNEQQKDSLTARMSTMRVASA
ncbi:hypothetical protein C8Q75DRAFT_860280 [Abortiporus biennis]|nr:hypothetical protein C8Q75DRAFT_860280 [Abortiporus biennis]